MMIERRELLMAGAGLAAASLSLAAGAATAAEALHPGAHVSVEIAGLGESRFTCV